MGAKSSPPRSAVFQKSPCPAESPSGGSWPCIPGVPPPTPPSPDRQPSPGRRATGGRDMCPLPRVGDRWCGLSWSLGWGGVRWAGFGGRFDGKCTHLLGGPSRLLVSIRRVSIGYLPVLVVRGCVRCSGGGGGGGLRGHFLFCPRPVGGGGGLGVWLTVFHGGLRCYRCHLVVGCGII